MASRSIAPSPRKYIPVPPRTIPQKKQLNVRWSKKEVFEWSKSNINAIIPDNVMSYGEIGKLARTHLLAIIYDYQFLAYQLTFEDISIDQIEETKKLMNSFLVIIKLLTTDEIDQTKGHNIYKNMVTNFRNWYADADNEYAQYKQRYIMKYMAYKFQYESVDTPQLMASFTAIRNQKFKEWIAVQRVYLPIFGRMFNRMKHTFMAMASGTFDYTSIVAKDYNSMVASLKPYVRVVNTYIVMLTEFSPKEKNNVFEYDAYFTPDILNNIKGGIDNFFHSTGVLPSTEADIDPNYPWIDEFKAITDQSTQIRTDIGIMVDKKYTYDSAKEEHLFNVKTMRERAMNTVAIMSLSIHRSQNPYYNSGVFSSLISELTGYYYILDEYKPKEGVTDEYTILSNQLRERLPVISKQIEAVFDHEKMIDDLLSVIQEEILTSESDASFAYSESDTMPSSIESTPIAESSQSRVNVSPSSLEERIKRVSPITDKPKSVSPPSLFERFQKDFAEVQGLDPSNLPYPTYGDDYFFDEFLRENYE
jgi:hypothetical protein